MSEFTVRTNGGLLRGAIKEDCFGKKYYSFQGVPYAAPPLGPLRFKAPRPAKPWSGIRDATQEGSACYSRHVFYQTLIGSEDCLFLNVYTPELPINDYPILKPVMFWIHGGVFLCGSGTTEICGPDYLLQHDIVLITINYRLGLLGFLTCDNPNVGCPGNAGLKDVVMALKWVHDNIERFCGDPNCVTIFGNSAGAAIVHYLILSPMAKGLFHRAIMQSGCALNCWAAGYNCFKDIRKFIEIDSDNDKEIFEYLQNIPVEKLFEIQEKLNHDFCASRLRPVAPIIEKISNLEPNFITQKPIDIIESGNYNHVPLIIGYCSNEGMLFDVIQNDQSCIATVDNFEKVIPHSYGIETGSERSKKISKDIQHFYNDKDTPQIDQFHKLITDCYFLEGIYRTAKLHAKTSRYPLYFYRMSLDTSLNFFKTLTHLTSPGACHGDDLGYIFKTFLSPDLEVGSIEEISVQRITKLWTNFCKNGNPNSPLSARMDLIKINWKSFKLEQKNYLDIGNELRVGIGPEMERMKFWENLMNYSTKCSKL